MRDRKIAIPVFILAFCLIGATFPQDAKDRVAPENTNEARLNRLQPPEEVMDIIGAAPGMTIAEIGAGRGRYVVHLAARVGPEGKIYAEDIEEAALRHCAERCRRIGFDNVETILGGFTDPKLPKNSLDLIFVISSYHHFNDPITLMKNALPALKPTGRLAIAEWVRLSGQRGEGTDPETMKIQMEEAGYVLESIDKTFENNRMYIYLFSLRPVEGLPILSGSASRRSSSSTATSKRLGRPARAAGPRRDAGGHQGQIHDRAGLSLFQGQDAQNEGHGYPSEQCRGDLGQDRRQVR